MKNNELQQVRPIYIHEADYVTNYQFSLISLVATLYRRKFLIAIVLIIFLSSGVAYALLTPRTYTSSVTVEVGSQIIDGSIQPFESADTLLAKIQYNYIIQTLKEHRQSNPSDKNRYKIKSSVPIDSNLAVLELDGTEEQTGTVHNLLQSGDPFLPG